MSVHPIFLPILKAIEHPIQSPCDLEHKPRMHDEEFPFFDEEAGIAKAESDFADLTYGGRQ